MSDDELNAIEARANAASAGPWWQKTWRTPDGTGRELSSLLCHFPDEGEPRFWRWDTDGEFVAHARTDVPALVAEIRQLREANAELAKREATANADRQLAEDARWGAEEEVRQLRSV